MSRRPCYAYAKPTSDIVVSEARVYAGCVYGTLEYCATRWFHSTCMARPYGVKSGPAAVTLHCRGPCGIRSYVHPSPIAASGTAPAEMGEHMLQSRHSRRMRSVRPILVTARGQSMNRTGTISRTKSRGVCTSCGNAIQVWSVR